MGHLTVSSLAAQRVLGGNLSLTCKHCGESNWRLANPAFQAKAAEGKTVLKCKTCASKANKAWYTTHDDVKKEASREYRTKPEVKAASKQYQQAYNEANRDRKNAAGSAYAKRHPGKRTALVMKRYVAKLQRTAPWADLAEIALFYENCPKGYHVDHIVPLRGELVSGLHVIENLQYLPASENCSKGNVFQID